MIDIIHEPEYEPTPQSLGRHLKVLTVTGTDLVAMGKELERLYRDWVETREKEMHETYNLYYDMHPISATVNSIVTKDISIIMTIFYNLEPRGANPEAPRDED